jgi:hypothetical protein
VERGRVKTARDERANMREVAMVEMRLWSVLWQAIGDGVQSKVRDAEGNTARHSFLLSNTECPSRLFESITLTLLIESITSFQTWMYHRARDRSKAMPATC